SAADEAAFVDAKRRLIDGAGHDDGQHGAGSILAEERIQDLQEQRLDSGCRFRDRRIEHQRSLEIEALCRQAVVASERDTRALDGELEFRKIETPVLQREVAAEVSEHVVDVLVFGLTASAATELVNLVLHRVRGELPAANLERSSELQLLHDIDISG